MISLKQHTSKNLKEF